MLKNRKESERITDKKIEKEKIDTIKKLQDLGFEVGYHNHYELGWVQKKFDELITNAHNLGINSPEKYYNDGKTKGKASRGHVIDGPKTKKEEAEERTEKIHEAIDTKIETISLESKYTATSFLEKPRLNDFPDMVEQNKTTELPKFLRFLSLR